jgi:hypothetical protein
MAKAKALDPDNWSTFDMVACTIPMISLMFGATGFLIGIGVWFLLAIRPRPKRKPKRDPETDPRYGDIRQGYVYVGDETWEPVVTMPSIWWQFRASPKEYNAVVKSMRENAAN